MASRTVQQTPQDDNNDTVAMMPFGKPEPKFGPKAPPPPPFNPDLDGDGDSDINHDPARKDDMESPLEPEAPEEEAPEEEVPDSMEGDIPPANIDGGSDEPGDDGTGEIIDTTTTTTTYDNSPNTVSEADLPTATEITETTTTTTTIATTTKFPPPRDKDKTHSYPWEKQTSSSSVSETTSTNTRPAEGHQTTPTSTSTSQGESDVSATSCITGTACLTNTAYPYETSCCIENVINHEAEDIENIFRDTGKLVAVILGTMVVSVLLTIGAIWAYKRRARKGRSSGGEKIGGDVEGGSSGGKKRRFWKMFGKGKKRALDEKTSEELADDNTPSQHPPAPIPPVLAQPNQRLSEVSRHSNRLSSANLLNRTLSTASSLTVPPYPGSLAAGTNRSNSTRTANSVSSNVTDDTVVRTKREYHNTVNRLAEQNMQSDHTAVADGFHCAPPNPFEEQGNVIAGTGGMGGSGVGVSGLGIVDAQGNRRTVHPPPPIIRVGDNILNPFEDPDMEDVMVADGFRHQDRSMHHNHHNYTPARLENPFADNVGMYERVDVGMGDGFRGYVPGQMMHNAAGNVNSSGSMGGGVQAPRRVSEDRLSFTPSISSSNETLRGDLEDWDRSHAGRGRRR